MPRPAHPAVLLTLAALAGAGAPAQAARTFTNCSEFVVCLVPDPHRLPPAGIAVTAGRGCAVRDTRDPAEALAWREEHGATGDGPAPIALRRLAPDWERAVLFLDPGATVRFAAAGETQGGAATRFRVGSPGRDGAGGILVHLESLAVDYAVEAGDDGGVRERLDGRSLEGAEKGGTCPYDFRRAGSEDPDLVLLDRPGPFACAIL